MLDSEETGWRGLGGFPLASLALVLFPEAPVQMIGAHVALPVFSNLPNKCEVCQQKHLLWAPVRWASEAFLPWPP